MKDRAIVLMFGALCAVACTTTNTPPGQGVTANVAGTTSPALAGSTAPSTAAGTTAAPPTAPTPAAGSTASGAAGATVSAGATAPAAGSGATAGMGAAGRSSGAGEVRPDTPATGDGAAPGSFQFVYNIALRDLCTTCHSAMGLFSSPDLSSAAKAYDSLVNKDATMMMPGQCGGKGKLITPGNCETSILYSKLSQTTPICGRHMPLSSDAMPTFVPKEGLDALCKWIKEGAKKD